MMGGKRMLNRCKDKKSQPLEYDISKCLEIDKEINPKWESLKISLIYGLFGIIWITVSSKLLIRWIEDIHLFSRFEIIKGWIYVLVTMVLLYFLVYRRVWLLQQAINKMYISYAEMSAMHEELTLVEEELRQQFEEIQKHRDALLMSEERYSLAVEGANDGIWDWHVETNQYFFSLQWKSAFGYQTGELKGTLETWEFLLHPEDRLKAKEKLQKYLMSGTGIYESVYRLKSKDGSYRWILSKGKGIRNKEGKVIRMAGSHTDITHQMSLQNSLLQERKFSEEILNHASVLILVWDLQGKIVKYNYFAQQLLGYSQEEMIGRRWVDMIIPKEDRIFIGNHVVNRLCKGEELTKNENKVRCKYGKYFDILWHNSFLRDKEGNILYIISIGEDITKRKKMENKLHQLAYYDPLTHLPNRSFFESYLKKILQNTLKEKDSFALLYIDMDNFKHINDTLGHVYGDEFLVYIGNLLQDYLSPSDFLARLSGDEFVILLFSINSREQLVQSVEEILTLLRQPFTIQGFEFFISASIGIALYPEHGKDMATLLKSADTAMFFAKEAGKDQYKTYTTTMKEKTLCRIKMMHQLRSVIQNNELLLYYQPQVDLKTGKVIGAEALIRWMHPQKGFISPNEFIPLAEETGDIISIGAWVFEVACKQKQKWKSKYGIPFIMSINLSTKQLMQKDLVPYIEELISSTKVSPDELQLEVTETAVMGDLKSAIDILQQLRSIGIKIALDDFGTGYSSLTYLRELPIDVVKMDRDFIASIESYQEHEVIVHAVIQLAHVLNLKVVAEGIETKEQLTFLRKYQCDVGQGYLFSKPLPPEEMEDVIENRLSF